MTAARVAMPRKLVLLRHAKSSWKDPTLDDHDRPLGKRGRDDAPRAGEAIEDSGALPDIVLCSTARRARQTAAAVVDAWHASDAAISLEAELYHGGPEAYLRLVAALSDDVEVALVVGHNPDIEAVIAYLTGVGEVMPTAAWAQIEFDTPTWRETARPGAGRLVRVWRPREDT